MQRIRRERERERERERATQTIQRMERERECVCVSRTPTLDKVKPRPAAKATTDRSVVHVLLFFTRSKAIYRYKNVQNFRSLESCLNFRCYFTFHDKQSRCFVIESLVFQRCTWLHSSLSLKSHFPLHWKACFFFTFFFHIALSFYLRSFLCLSHPFPSLPSLSLPLLPYVFLSQCRVCVSED